MGKHKGHIPRKLKISVFDRDESACQVCNATTDLCLGHKVAPSQGGTNAPDNLMVLCRTCLGFKRNLPLSVAEMRVYLARYEAMWVEPDERHTKVWYLNMMIARDRQQARREA